MESKSQITKSHLNEHKIWPNCWWHSNVRSTKTNNKIENKTPLKLKYPTETKVQMGTIMWIIIEETYDIKGWNINWFGRKATQS